MISTSTPGVASRPTLIPAFDVQTYARAVDEDEARPPTITLTNEVELEAARLVSARASYVPPLIVPLKEQGAEDPVLEFNTADVDISAYEAEAESDEAAIARCRARLTPLDRVPTLARSVDELMKMRLGSELVLLLHFVDGVLSLEAILDVSGIPMVDALRLLVELEDRRIISLPR